MTARKDDSGKPDLSLIPYVAQVAMAEAFMVGLRYGRYNYCGGMEASRIVAALMRHVGQWFDGEERDKDGQHHLGSVMACAAMLLRQQQLGTLKDDRYKPATVDQPAPVPLWGVFARGKNTNSHAVGYYDDRETAECMAKTFHVRDWPTPHYTLVVKEVDNATGAA